MQKNITIAAIVILVGAGSFFGGMKYGQSAQPKFAGGAGNFRMAGAAGANAGQRGQSGARGGMGGFNGGEVLSMDDKSMTLKLRDGGSKIVFYTPSTTVSKEDAGSLSDIKVGDNVTVVGSANTDGSLNATSVQKRALPLAPAPAATQPTAVK